MKSLILVLGFAGIFQCCSFFLPNDGTDESKISKRIDQFKCSSEAAIYSDFVLCTAYFWIDHTRLYRYSNYRNQFYEFEVPLIYFNHDSSKFIAILTTKCYKDSLTFEYYANPHDSFTYDYQMMICVREGDSVLIYPLKIKTGYGETSWVGAAAEAIHFLEKELANRSISANNTPNKSVELKYNILEPNFWERSPLFKKGLQVDGYYYFQNYDNSSNLNPTFIKLPSNPCIPDFLNKLTLESR